MNYPISEIFETIQWEWRNTWKPSIFIRFWWCNLQCTWCDSKYSWDSKVEKAKNLDLQEILEKIKLYKPKHIVFTWWEPTLFQKQIKEIQNNLWKEYTYEIETNWSKEITENLVFEQVNISPKLSNSWNKKYNLDILNNTNYFTWNIDLKFVSDWSDLHEIKEEIQNIIKKYKINKIWIYIMPLWTTKESQLNYKVLNFCIENWYNYCLREHIILFWDKKWV